ncbi:hypothetical protein HY256_08130, partial [Candidatus Sumerlaeota bacterium]|nr:hypothetical protein [Candidatus Sumerlaeota bacterium]
GWEPENFDRKFHGTMTAAEALRRSLNVPAILVAEKAGIARCFGLIEAAGIRMPQNAQSRTGLAFAVGACEVTLLDLTNGYATLGRGGIRIAPRLFTDEPKESISVLNPNVCAAVDEILSSRARRPNIRGGALANPSAKEAPWFMWKTGTSAGRRDAWAVGHNHRYAVGVWVGRFAGAGEIEYVGAVAAEPLLASIFSLPSVGENGDPNPALPIFTDTPRRPVIRSNNPLRIVSPRHGATFLAVGGQCPIYPRAEQDDGDEGLTWFINGRYLAPSDSERLALGEGRYELRCADTSGHASAVRFEIH